MLLYCRFLISSHWNSEWFYAWMDKRDCGLLLGTMPELACKGVRRITAALTCRIFGYGRFQLDNPFYTFRIQDYWISIACILSPVSKRIFAFQRPDQVYRVSDKKNSLDLRMCHGLFVVVDENAWHLPKSSWLGLNDWRHKSSAQVPTLVISTTCVLLLTK